MKDHLKEACFKLKGYPEWFEKRQQKAKFQAGKGGNAYLADTPCDMEDESQYNSIEQLVQKKVSRLMGNSGNASSHHTEMVNFVQAN